MNISSKWKERIVHANLSGLSNLVRAESSKCQLVWFLIYIMSTLFTAYLFVESLLKYMKCEVNSTVRRNMVNQLNFPKVTFCNRNPLSSEYFLDFISKADVELTTDQYYMLIKLESYMKNTSGRYLTLEEKLNMSDLEGMLISCMFRNKPCSFNDDFIAISDSYWLNCIRFNSGFDSSGRSVGPKKVYSAKDELSVEFYLGLPDRMTSDPMYAELKFLFVWIHDFSTTFIRLPDNALRLETGLDVTVQASPHIYKQFNQWPFGYSDCTVTDDNKLLKSLSDPSIFDYVCAENVKYTRESCINICYQQLLAKQCDCIDFWPNVTIAGYDYCFDTKAECSETFYYTVFITEDFVTKHCLDHCPAECVRRTITNQLAFQRYPKASYVEHTLKTNQMLINKYANQSDFEYNLARNVIRVNIRYDSLAYKETEEESRMSWKSLLGELGGDLHILLGMSLISFIDIFELIGFLVSESIPSISVGNRFGP